MKYIYALILIIIVFILIIPVLFIRWDLAEDGFSDVVDGIMEICGID